MQSVRCAAITAACLVAYVGAGHAGAAILVDSGPAGSPYVFTTMTGPHTSIVSSRYGFQEFIVRAELAQDSVVRGMTIYTGSGIGQAGTPAVMRVFTDLNGAMDSEIAQRVGTIDQVAQQPGTFVDRPDWNVTSAHATFADTRLAAGTYWFSMSGWAGADIGWLSYVEDGAPKVRYDQAQLNHDLFEVGDEVFVDHTSLYRLPYLLDGSAPEPATWALLIAGFGLTGAMLRRRRAAIDPQ